MTTAITILALVASAFWALYPEASKAVLNAEGDGGSDGGGSGGWDMTDYDDIPF